MSAPQYCNREIHHITIRNLVIASGPTFFFKFEVQEAVMEEENFLLDSHPYSHETSIFTLGAPHEEVQGAGKQNFTQVLLVQTSAAFPEHLNSSRCPHCSVQPVLMMSSRTSS